jgi:hypothetical protein
LVEVVDQLAGASRASFRLKLAKTLIAPLPPIAVRVVNGGGHTSLVGRVPVRLIEQPPTTASEPPPVATFNAATFLRTTTHQSFCGDRCISEPGERTPPLFGVVDPPCEDGPPEGVDLCQPDLNRHPPRSYYPY